MYRSTGRPNLEEVTKSPSSLAMKLTNSNYSSIPLPQLKIRWDQSCRKQNRSDSSDQQIRPGHTFVIGDLSSIRIKKVKTDIGLYTLSVRINKASRPPHSAIVPITNRVAFTHVYLLEPLSALFSRWQQEHTYYP